MGHWESRGGASWRALNGCLCFKPSMFLKAVEKKCTDFWEAVATEGQFKVTKGLMMEGKLSSYASILEHSDRPCLSERNPHHSLLRSTLISPYSKGRWETRKGRMCPLVQKKTLDQKQREESGGAGF